MSNSTIQRVAPLVVALVVVLGGMPTLATASPSAAVERTQSPAVASSGASVTAVAPTSSSRFTDSFEDEPADSGIPDAWSASQGTISTSNVTTARATDGSQSAYIEGSDTFNSITPTDHPYANRRSGWAKVSVYALSGDAGGADFELTNFDGVVAHVRVNSQGTLQYKNNNSNWVGLGAKNLNDEWVTWNITNIDTSKDTFTLEWTADGTTYTNSSLEFVSTTNGYNRVQLGSGEKAFFDDVDLPGGPELQGIVKDQDGSPVSNATIVATAYYPNLTDDVRDLRERYQNATPPKWEPDRDLLQNDGLMQDPGGNQTYVAVHSGQNWELRSGMSGPWSPDDVNLGEPKLVVDSEEPVVMSIWDAGNEAICEDNVDNELPGDTTAGTIVLERLDGGGNLLDAKQRSDTTAQIRMTSLCNAGSKKHHAAVFDNGLPTGFYRVYPENNPTASYVLAVAPNGDLSRIDEQTWIQDLETKAGKLAHRAQEYSDITNKSGVAVLHRSANDTGHFTFNNLPGNPDQVDIIAYRKPAGMDSSDYSGDYPTQGEIAQYQNTTLSDLRSGDRLTEATCNGAADQVDSIYAPAGMATTSPPESGVTVKTRELAVSEFVSAVNKACLEEDIRDLLASAGLMDLLGKLDLEEMSLKELKSLYNRLEEVAGSNPKVCQTVADHAGVENPDCPTESGDGSGGAGGIWPEPPENRDEYEDRIRNISEVITSVGITGEACTPEVVEKTNESITVECDTGIDGIDASDAIVTVDRSNGTRDLISGNNSTYVTVEDTLGGDVARLENYPLGNVSSVQIGFKIITPGGVAGGDSDPIRNPDFTGELPDIQAIRLSCSQCAPDDRVEVEVIPEDGTTVQQVSQVRADGPGNGVGPPVSTPADNKAAFNLENGTGVYRTEVVIQSSSGHNFTEIVKLEATDANTDRPPTLRATTGPIGTYAIVSDGFTSGAVTASANGDQIRSLGVIPSDADAPTRTHVYTAGLEPAASHDTKLVVARGVASEQQLGQRVGTVVHEPAVNEDGIVYRQDHQPIPREGSNQFGRMTTTLQNGTVVETYSEADGVVSISTNANPGWVDRQIYSLRLQFPDASGWIPDAPDLPDLPGVVFPSGGIGLLGAAAGLIGRRGWSA